jgi:hypothetical protein
VSNFLDRKQAMEKDWRIQFANNNSNNNSNNYSNYNNKSVRNNIYTIVGISVCSHILYEEDGHTVMRRLTTRIRSEKCVVRRFRCRANVRGCTYTNLDGTVQPTAHLGYMV